MIWLNRKGEILSQDKQKFPVLGLNQILTEEILKTSDQFGCFMYNFGWSISTNFLSLNLSMKFFFFFRILQDLNFS